MTIAPLINHHCSRAYALTELLDTIHNQVDAALNDSADDPLGVLERAKNLLHGAHELADGLTVSINDLYVKALESQSDEKESSADGHIRITDLGVTYYTFDVLRREGISTIDKLTSMTEPELLQLPSIGRKTINNIKERLAANGLSLSSGGES